MSRDDKNLPSAVREAIRVQMVNFGEIPDRTSPDDFPDGYVLTREEIVDAFVRIIEVDRAARSSTPQKTTVQRYTQVGSGMVPTFQKLEGKRYPAGDWVQASDYDQLERELAERSEKAFKAGCQWERETSPSAIVADDMVAVKRSDLSMWAAWFEECAAHDMQAEYEDGSKTPNAGTFECFAKDMRALLGTSDDTSQKP